MPNETEGGGWEERVPEFQDITVAPEDLAQFAELLGGDREALQSAWESALDELADQSPPNFGGHGHGIYEGAEYQRAYWLTLGAQLKFMVDAIRGLAILEEGAARIHADYVATDQGSGAALDQAFVGYEQVAVEYAFHTHTEGEGGAADDEPI